MNDRLIELYKKLHLTYPKLPADCQHQYLLSEKFAEESFIRLNESIDTTEMRQSLDALHSAFGENDLLDYLTALNNTISGDFDMASKQLNGLINKGYWLPYRLYFAINRKIQADYEMWRQMELDKLTNLHGKGQLYFLIELAHHLRINDFENADFSIKAIRNASRWNSRTNAYLNISEFYVLLYRRHFESAQSLLSKTTKLLSNESKFHCDYFEALVLYGRGHWNDAIQALQKYERSFSEYKQLAEDPGFHRKMAHCLYKADRFEDALKYIDTHDAIDPSNGAALILRAMCYDKLERFEETIVLIGKKSELNRPEIYFLGKSYYKTGNSDAILQLIDRWEEINDEPLMFLYSFFVSCHFENNRIEELKKLARSRNFGKSYPELKAEIREALRSNGFSLR